MAQATFKTDFDYRVPLKPGVTIAYKAGWSGKVPQAHLEAAEKAGAVKAPEKREGGSDDGGRSTS